MSAAYTLDTITDLDTAWPALEALLRDSFEYYQDIVGYGPPPDWVQELQGVLRPGPRALVLLAQVDGAPVGFANARLRTDPGSPPQRYVYVDNVYVVATARSLGVGSSLLQRCEAWARECGVAELRLDVLEHNDIGKAFWARRGFEPHAHILAKALQPEAT